MKIMKLASLLLALAVIAAACGGASDVDENANSAVSTTADSATTTSASSTTVAASNTSVFSIEQGDCLIEAVTDEQSSVPIVPCDQPHDSEVYTAFAMDEGDYPGAEAISEIAGEGCLARFEPIFREAYEISPYFVSFLFPTEVSWNDEDDREVLCLANGPELLVGSILPDRSDSDPVLAAAIAAAITAPDEDGDLSPFPIEEASCASGWIVNDIGSDRLLELGVSATSVGQIDDIEFSDAELELIVAALGDCADMSRLIGDALVSDGTFSEADGDCFATEFDEAVLEQAFKTVLRDSEAELDSDEFINEFIDVAGICNIAL